MKVVVRTVKTQVVEIPDAYDTINWAEEDATISDEAYKVSKAITHEVVNKLGIPVWRGDKPQTLFIDSIDDIHGSTIAEW